MKSFFKIFAAAVMTVAAVCGCTEKKPRVAIVGVGIECSTFSPARTTLDMFRPLYGDEIIKSYPFFEGENNELLARADWVPTIVAWATPGGMVTRECYDTLLNQSLRLLRENMPYDGIFLDIHGAMSVEGLDDPEGDYITRIREVVGDDVLISTSMDPHGCVSPRLAQNTDLITSYRMAPHTDRYISRERAIVNLLDRLESGKGKPAYKAWVKVPILLPGEKTSTRVDPGKSLYAAIEPIEAQDGVIDAAIWMSYPWADEPRNHGVVMVTGDDSAQVAAGAKSLAEHFWSVRISMRCWPRPSVATRSLTSSAIWVTIRLPAVRATLHGPCRSSWPVLSLRKPAARHSCIPPYPVLRWWHRPSRSGKAAMYAAGWVLLSMTVTLLR